MERRRTPAPKAPAKPLEKYPVDSKGNMMSWLGDAGDAVYSIRDTPVWLPNEPMELTLVLESASRHRSSASFVLTDQKGRIWNMFLTDMVQTMLLKHFNRGCVHGWWIVARHGMAYGLRLHPSEIPSEE